MKNRSVEVMLFDLGGVLVELGESPVPPQWLEKEDGFTLADWFSSKTAMLFERGQISAQEFAERFKADLNIESECDEILTHFTAWPIGLYEGADELLMELKNDFTLAVLSNSNELHWPRIIDEFKLPTYIEHIYSSHLLNIAKPDAGAFKRVIGELNVEPAKVLFFDDNLKNIEVASSLGINSQLVSGVQQIRDALIKLDLLSD